MGFAYNNILIARRLSKHPWDTLCYVVLMSNAELGLYSYIGTLVYMSKSAELGEKSRFDLRCRKDRGYAVERSAGVIDVRFRIDCMHTRKQCAVLRRVRTAFINIMIEITKTRSRTSWKRRGDG